MYMLIYIVMLLECRALLQPWNVLEILYPLLSMEDGLVSVLESLGLMAPVPFRGLHLCPEPL